MVCPKVFYLAIEFIQIQLPDLLCKSRALTLQPAQMNLQISLSATITVNPCFLEVGSKTLGALGVKGGGKAQIRIIVNSDGDW